MSFREWARRCLVSAVGGVLAALVLLVVPAHLCTGTGCWVVPILQEPLLFAGAWLLSAAAMALGRVRPAWPVASAGPFLALALVVPVVDTANRPVVAILALTAAGYALAAIVTAAELPRAWRVALLTPAVVLFVWSVTPHLLPAP
ncbi:hypothetical protein [Amycolatopsis sp. NPDC021455]|uniref:hypothetical protein n=1 Tax=Amycolatopsis sp. NPDC021455 TaxID=3154901 RepID=UPI0033ED2186